jgi:ketopantoate hydroxymethyltransferase
MPQSRNRHKHHHPQHAQQADVHLVLRQRKKRRASGIMAVLICIMGSIIAGLIDGTLPWIALSAGIGAGAGYLLGHAIDKNLSPKKSNEA